MINLYFYKNGILIINRHESFALKDFKFQFETLVLQRKRKPGYSGYILDL